MRFAILWGALLVASSPTHAQAQILKAVDYVFPELSTPTGEPDPAVWARTGNLAPQRTSGGLQISNQDHDGSLLYSFSAAEIGESKSRTTFRASFVWNAAADTVAAWSSDTVGARILLDDAQRRLVLGFGRDPETAVRQVVVLGAQDVAPIPFAWDNQLPNVFEVARLANGDFSISMTSGDPARVDPPIQRTIRAAQLPSTTGPAMVGFGLGTLGGGAMLWKEAHAVIERGILAFTSLAAGAQIGLAPDGSGDLLVLEAHFALGEGNDGINPLTEEITLEVGNASWVIPRGSFRRTAEGFAFQERIGSARLDLLVRALPEGRFVFGADVENAPLEGATNPLPITLIIGDDGVTTDVIAWLVP